MRTRVTLYSLMALFFTASFCQADEEVSECPLSRPHAAAIQTQAFDLLDEADARHQYLDQVDNVLSLWMHRLSYLARMCDRLQTEFKWAHTHPLMRFVRDPLFQKEQALFFLREDLRYVHPSQTKSQVEILVDNQKIDAFMMTDVLFGNAFLSVETPASFSKQDLDTKLSIWIDTLEEKNRQIRLNLLSGASSYTQKDRLMLIEILQGLWLFRDEVRYAGPTFPFPFLSEHNQE
jgi:hypothetical protein